MSDDQEVTGAVARVLDVGREDGEERSPPLIELFRQGVPVLTLADALAPVADQIYGSGDALLLVARRKAERTKELYPGLSDDDRAMLTLYTVRCEPPERSPYYQLNGALLARNRDLLRPWLGFIGLLLHALRKLPGFAGQTVIRGTGKAAAEMGDQCRVGALFRWSAFASVTTRLEVMDGILGKSGPRTMWQLELLRPGIGREIRDFSLGPGDAEVLLPPGLQFRVLSAFDAGDGLTLVQAVQVEAEPCDMLDMRPPPDAREAVESTALLLRLRAVLEEFGMPQTAVQEAAALIHVACVQIAVIGPTSSGKSTLINAFFGAEIVPSGALPVSMLPVVFYSTDGARGFGVAVCGDGLQELLGRLDIKVGVQNHKGLSAQEAYDLVVRFNAAARVALQEDPAALLAEYPEIADWHLEVMVPGSDCPYHIVDCPGGSEGGDSGRVVEAIIGRRVRAASLLLLTVAPGALVTLTDRSQIERLCGGVVPDRDTIVAVTKIEHRKTREEAEQFLSSQRVNLQPLKVRETLYVSGRRLLAWKLFRQLPEVLRKSLPLYGTPAFEANRSTIRKCFEAVTEGMPDDEEDFEQDYGDQRRRLPERLGREVERPWADTTTLETKVAAFAEQEWPRLVRHHAAELILKEAAAELERRVQDLEHASQTVEDARQLQLQLEAALSPPRLARLREQLKAALETSGGATLMAFVERAVEVLTKPQSSGSVTDVLRNVTDDLLAASLAQNWNTTHECFVGRRYAEAFVVDFYQWCGRTAARALSLDLGAAVAASWLRTEGLESGNIPDESAAAAAWAGPRLWERAGGAAGAALRAPGRGDVLTKATERAWAGASVVALSVAAPAILVADGGRKTADSISGSSRLAVGGEKFPLHEEPLGPVFFREAGRRAIGAVVAEGSRLAAEAVADRLRPIRDAAERRVAVGTSSDLKFALASERDAREAVEKIKAMLKALNEFEMID